MPMATTVMPPITLITIHRVMLEIPVLGSGVLLPYLDPNTPAAITIMHLHTQIKTHYNTSNPHSYINMHTHAGTHTHTQPFYGSMDFV